MAFIGFWGWKETSTRSCIFLPYEDRAWVGNTGSKPNVCEEMTFDYTCCPGDSSRSFNFHTSLHIVYARPARLPTAHLHPRLTTSIWVLSTISPDVCTSYGIMTQIKYFCKYYAFMQHPKISLYTQIHSNSHKRTFYLLIFFLWLMT